MASGNSALAQQSAALLTTLCTPFAEIEQSIALVATDAANSRYAFDQQSLAEVSRLGEPLPLVSQSVVIVAYSTNIREDNTQRSWAFDFDGHSFYVLALGTQETVVYDFLTEQWSQFRTQGFPIWNAEIGLMWRGEATAFDFQTGDVYVLDPDEPLDEGFRSIKRVATGLMIARGRNSATVGGITVNCSVGDTQNPNPLVNTADMTLSFSDDQGNTYFTFGEIELRANDFDQEIRYLSLGRVRAPGRVWRIEDEGGPVRLSSVEYDLSGGQ
jgi:hypothetical protein